METSTVRILLADDHPILRDGTRQLLLQNKAFEVVGEANDGVEALELVKKLQPDLIIFDISMPNLNGVELARQLGERFPQVKMIVLTVHNDFIYQRTLQKFGVKAVISKNTPGRELIETVQAVLNGRLLLADTKSDQSENEMELNLSRLSLREIEVLHRIVEGERNSEIAKDLVISPKTLETHIRNLYGKLGVNARSEILINRERWRILLSQFTSGNENFS